MTIAGNDKLTALKHLANGRDPDFTAAAIKADVDEVTALGTEYGWPDMERLRWSIDELQRQARVEERASLPKATLTSASQAVGAAPRSTPRTVPTQGASVTVTSPGNPVRPVVDSISGLLHRADQLDDGPGTAAVRRAAKKVRDAGLALQHALDDVETKHRAAREAAEKKARLRADVERLERELAAKKAALRGTTAPTKPTAAATDAGEPTARQIRAWASEHDVPCPPVGRVPAAVREQYAAAHVSDAA